MSFNPDGCGARDCPLTEPKGGIGANGCHCFDAPTGGMLHGGRLLSAVQQRVRALRSRVEALEGANERLREEVRRRLPQPTLEAASAAATLAQVIAALARLTDEKALARAGMEALNDLKLHGSKARADEIRRACAAVQPDKGEAICAECERDPSVTPGTCECRSHRDVGNVRPAKTARQQPDKGERCGGTGRRLRPEPVHSPALLASWSDEPCPGCPDCSEAP